MRDQPGPDDAPDDPDVDADRGPTSGERLLYALGQMYRHWRSGQLDVHPNLFDIEDLARIIGAWRDVEFLQEDLDGTSYHFPGEVLHVDPEAPFPWRLLEIWDWAAEQEVKEVFPRREFDDE